MCTAEKEDIVPRNKKKLRHVSEMVFLPIREMATRNEKLQFVCNRIFGDVKFETVGAQNIIRLIKRLALSTQGTTTNKS